MSHPIWNDGALGVNAEYVEFHSTSRAIEFGPSLREMVEGVVFATEHVLSIPTPSATAA